MKTAIRSYHPVPALQRTSGNLQDAPRIKHMLKAVTLEGETGPPPCIPTDILSRLVCFAPIHRAHLTSTFWIRGLVMFPLRPSPTSFLA
jgi:hypothetical protein